MAALSFRNGDNAYSTTATNGNGWIVSFQGEVLNSNQEYAFWSHIRGEAAPAFVPNRALQRRLLHKQKMKQAELDAKSRQRRRPERSILRTTQRLQTAQAAMDAREAAGCCR